MKRVMCLYRVSTKGQVDPQDDIPMQRRECLDFISRQPEWKFTGELMEKGVSGYKISASKRDATEFEDCRTVVRIQDNRITEIRHYAEVSVPDMMADVLALNVEK